MTPDAVILRALRGSGDAGASGADLAQRLGISRAAVWARIEELRRVGYDIEASPHRGYLLRGAPDVLHADDLMARLEPGGVIGRDIRVFHETASTNDIADRLARDGVAEGIVILAESQTQGRGRLGRRWDSPAGRGLWMSVLLRPSLHPSAATQLTVLAAVACVRAIERQVPLRPDIKWPNDLMFGTRKCGGILLEMSAELDHIRHVVLGLGLDVNVTASEFPAALRPIATSLQAQLGRRVDRAALAASVIGELDRAYRALGSGGFPALADEWEERCATLGRRVTIRMGARELTGTAESIDDDGALCVRTEHGRLERVVGGDVSLAAAP
ncbi:MAG: biotin--[acetyl-CoA-carboxylase] ligase [Verrucomicrobia bacterium]|nr:biotin--[acetyl-CoA-carboxylase] ligase [Verrucomicrobiota bacterium]